MTDKEIKALQQFVETSSATVTILTSLIEDLAPIIGYDEANRLMKIYIDAQAKYE
jgi:hypothetical protein